MAFILNLDASAKKATVSLASDGHILGERKNDIQKDHSTFLHTAILDLMTELSISFSQLNAIAVTHGPGSYTGLRVGLSTAKGLCYASGLPLILVGSLPCIAYFAIQKINNKQAQYCAMIDARRMEVFTAMYNHQLMEKLPPQALILNKNSFSEYAGEKIIFAGEGASKFEMISELKDAEFIIETDVTQSLAQLSFRSFEKKEFVSLAYSEPLYIKEFQSF